MQFIIIQKLALPRRGRPSGTLGPPTGITRLPSSLTLFLHLSTGQLYLLLVQTFPHTLEDMVHTTINPPPRASPLWKEWPLALDAGIRRPGRGPSLALLKSDAPSSWALLPYHPPWREGAYCNIFPLCMGCGFLSLHEGGKGRKTTKS